MKALNRRMRKLSAQLQENRQESVLKRMQDMKLKRDYEEAVGLLERIPKEILDMYAKPQDAVRARQHQRGSEL